MLSVGFGGFGGGWPSRTAGLRVDGGHLVAMPLMFEAGQFPCPDEDAAEHRAVEPAGIRISQRRMVAAEQMESVWQQILGSVRELVG